MTLLSIALGFFVLANAPVAVDQDATPVAPPCDVTLPNGQGIPTETPHPMLYGNSALSMRPWPNGTVVFRPGGPGYVTLDGALGMKFGWRRGVPGRLTIVGRRLDASGPPLRAWIPTGYGDIGFQSTSIIFPSPGCWEVTGRVGRGSLTFVTRVRKIGDGPDVVVDH